MAGKKALIILAPATEITGTGTGMEKLLKKAALATNYTLGNVLEGVGETTVVTPEGVATEVKKDTPLIVVDLGNADNAALNAALTVILESVDRKTTIAVAGKTSLAFYGSGINAKAGTLARAVNAADIMPTLAYIADFPLLNTCVGAIIYQALKSPNLKMEEIGKLKEALIRMEGALARDNREPWDKHDCA